MTDQLESTQVPAKNLMPMPMGSSNWIFGDYSVIDMDPIPSGTGFVTYDFPIEQFGTVSVFEGAPILLISEACTLSSEGQFVSAQAKALREYIAESPTGGNTFILFAAAKAADQQEIIPAYTAGEMVSIIRSSLSLNITELASILRVERPTIYAWLGERAVPQEDNLERLRNMLHFATYWAKTNRMPLAGNVRVAYEKDLSLVELLSEDPTKDDKIIQRLDAISKSMKASTKPGAVAGVKPGLREAALRHGLDLSQITDQQDTLDSLTGKRSSPE